MSIKGYIDELEILKKEISRNNARNRSLHKRIHVIEQEIAQYLRAKEQAGVKYRGRTVVLQTKERRPPKQRSQKKQDVMELLENLGISDPQQAYEQLMDAQRGDPVERESVKISKMKEGT